MENNTIVRLVQQTFLWHIESKCATLCEGGTTFHDLYLVIESFAGFPSNHRHGQQLICLLVKVFAVFFILHKSHKVSSYLFFSGYRKIKSTFNSCSRLHVLVKVLADNTHHCANGYGKFSVAYLLIQTRTCMQVLLNHSIWCHTSSEGFLEQGMLRLVPTMLLLLLIQNLHQTQEMSLALICKANIQISEIESYLTMS